MLDTKRVSLAKCNGPKRVVLVLAVLALAATAVPVAAQCNAPGGPAFIDIDDPVVVEGDAGTTTLQFTITVTGGTVFAITDWATFDIGSATDGVDYVGASGKIDAAGIPPAGDVETYPVSITVNGDLDFEPDETLELRITNASVGPPCFCRVGGDCPSSDEAGPGPVGTTGTGTIENDDDPNNPPSADAGGPYSVAEGGSVALSAAGSSDPEQATNTLTFAWDLDDDGAFDDAGGIGPTFSAAGRDGPDSQTVKVRVTDSGGLSDVAMATVSITNVAPTVGAVAVAPEPSDEGETAEASADFSDPGVGDTFTCTVDYGEGDGPQAGTVAGTTCTGPPHAYGDEGSYTVEVCVADDDGGSDCNSTLHEVLNVPPAVDPPAVDPEPSDEGEEVEASSDFTDAGDDDSPFTCTVDYGDGSGAQAGSVAGTTCTGPSHTYADDGPYAVEICVTDADGGTGCASAQHAVLNVAPTITASTSSAEDCGATPEGGLVEVSADFSDPGYDGATAGTLEDFDASEIDWGDGTVEAATVAETPGAAGTPTTGTASGSHIYGSGGIYTVTVTVEDDDGGSDSVELTALVTGAGLNAGEVQVVGTDFKDVVNVKRKGADLEVMAGFLGPGKAAFPLSDVDLLRVLACDGDDQVHVDHKLGVPAMLDGGAGRDHLRAGDGPTLLTGGHDDDHLFGGDAEDVLDGGDGDDRLWGGPNDDTLLGGEGDDRLFGDAGDDLLDGGPGLDACHGGPAKKGTDVTAHCE